MALAGGLALRRRGGNLACTRKAESSSHNERRLPVCRWRRQPGFGWMLLYRSRPVRRGGRAGAIAYQVDPFPAGLFSLDSRDVTFWQVTRETAGYLISAAGFLLSIWLLWDTGIQLGGPPLLTFILTAVWITNQRSVLYASAVQTESIFTRSINGDRGACCAGSQGRRQKSGIAGGESGAWRVSRIGCDTRAFCWRLPP